MSKPNKKNLDLLAKLRQVVEGEETKAKKSKDDEAEVKVMTIHANSPEDAAKQIREQMEADLKAKGKDPKETDLDAALSKLLKTLKGKQKAGRDLFGITDMDGVYRAKRNFPDFFDAYSQCQNKVIFHMNRGELEDAMKWMEKLSMGAVFMAGLVKTELGISGEEDEQLANTARHVIRSASYDPKKETMYMHDDGKHCLYVFLEKGRELEMLQEMRDGADSRREQEAIDAIRLQITDKGKRKDAH